MKKITISLFLILIVMVAPFSVSATANTIPYTNYTYSEVDKSIVEGPQAYIPETVIYGIDLGIGNFLLPTDIDTDANGDIYVLDAGNSRVVVLTSQLKLKATYICNINGENIDLKSAKGITVSGDNYYICDTENSRILVHNKENGESIRVIGTPTSSVLDENFIFQPTRISVDEKGNLFVVSNGTYEGILNLKSNGDFVTFFATNNVTTNAWDQFWRRYSTKQQRKTMTQLIPQDFSSIDIDEQGFFMITTRKAVNNSMVKRVNPGGSDVIRNLSNISLVGDSSSTSSFVDISAGPDKIYACLEKNSGRIFCYNNDGYMIYNFGSLSSQKGGFKNPISLTYLDDYRIAVLDIDRGSITVFNTTDYADTIHRGIKYQNELEYDKATEEWEQVLGYNSNYLLALKMIGTKYYESGEYKKAKEYFKLCNDKESYSDARKQIRSEWIYSNAWIILTAVVLLAGLAGYFKISEIIKNKKDKKRLGL